MTNLNKNLISVLVFPLFGLASAYLAIRTNWTLLGKYNFFGGLGFGFLMCVCFWMFAGLRSIWRTLAFILISPAAALLAALVSVALAGHLPSYGSPSEYLPEKCVGGYAGAFLLISAMLLLLERNARLLVTILKSAAWAVPGAIFASAATELADKFRPVRFALDIHQGEDEIALMMV